jgi:hypothetical protein
LTGARLFFGSLEAAIFLFSAITAIRDTNVVPVINTNHTAAIAGKSNHSVLIEQINSLVFFCSHP